MSVLNNGGHPYVLGVACRIVRKSNLNKKIALMPILYHIGSMKHRMRGIKTPILLP